MEPWRGRESSWPGSPASPMRCSSGRWMGAEVYGLWGAPHGSGRPSGQLAQRLRQPPLGHPRRHDRVADLQAADGLGFSRVAARLASAVREAPSRRPSPTPTGRPQHAAGPRPADNNEDDDGSGRRVVHHLDERGPASADHQRARRDRPLRARAAIGPLAGALSFWLRKEPLTRTSSHSQRAIPSVARPAWAPLHAAEVRLLQFRASTP
jgi:hypothetical protein